jgi:hypothetical protein
VTGPPTWSSMYLIASLTKSTFHCGNGVLRGAFIIVSCSVSKRAASATLLEDKNGVTPFRSLEDAERKLSAMA